MSNTDNTRAQELEKQIANSKEEENYLTDVDDNHIAIIQKIAILLVRNSENITQPVYLTLPRRNFPDIDVSQIYRAFKCINHGRNPMSIFLKSLNTQFLFTMVTGEITENGERLGHNSENQCYIIAFGREFYGKDEGVKRVTFNKEILNNISLNY